MPLPIYLAMTAAEFQQNSAIERKIAWMACHFSPYGTGLSNLPDRLPPDAILMVNDRTPVCGHDPILIAEQLKDLVDQFSCSRVLLDLQRPNKGETARIAEAILSALSCPVGISEQYAKDLDCPVFLPPVPLLQTPEEYLSAWHGRTIWLEMALSKESYRISEQGCKVLPFSPGNRRILHREKDLHCRYSIDMGCDTVTFSIERNWEDLQTLQAEAEKYGVQCFVGLYQELG